MPTAFEFFCGGIAAAKRKEKKVGEEKLFEVVFDDLRRKFGALAVDFATAAKEIGFRTVAAAHTARARGQFPLAVVRRGGRIFVTVGELARFAIGQQEMPAASPPRRPGRPTKSEQLARARGQK